jgi:hypothetical protein
MSFAPGTKVVVKRPGSRLFGQVVEVASRSEYARPGEVAVKYGRRGWRAYIEVALLQPADDTEGTAP